MGDENNKVFSSTIIRTKRKTSNNYKELLQVEPATPIVSKSICVKSCSYEPKNDKCYIPKKKNGTKVKTVKEIRLMLEKDVYSYLFHDLEMQQNYLLRKIKLGCLKDPKLQSTAKKILTNDSPLSRTVWRILMNINPDNNIHPTQFVFWNGKNIKINGSKGGNNKFIHRFDISKTNNVTTHRNRKGFIVKSQKKELLQNSLQVKFKPGPLTKKKSLDTSYQKYNFGDLELVKLPKPGLEVQPSYGKFIPPAISAFLYHSFAENSNILSENWATFAVSVLGTTVNGTPVQSKENCGITYDLNYKCYQNRLLMRRDSEKTHGKILPQHGIKQSDISVSEHLIIDDVKNIMNDILQTVEISLQQDKMYTLDEDLSGSLNEEKSVSNIQSKDSKAKKRQICELDRLDVTVIRLSENIEKKLLACTNSYCNLGCICDSLSCNYIIKGHCGRIECMFQCTCDFSGYRIGEFLEQNNCTSYLPEIVSKEKTCSLKLAKEEKEFRQTVIFTEDRSIVLKSRKRDCKASKKYASFFSNLNDSLKTEKSMKKELCVIVNKLNCTNIEPFCMTHNLYRCFCKGKFISTTIEPAEEIKNISQVETKLFSSNEATTINLDSSAGNVEALPNPERTIRSLRIKSRQAAQVIPDKITLKNKSIMPSQIETNNGTPYETCARIQPYSGRKYSNEYYLATNVKIKEMETNDVKLQKKLNKIINQIKTGSIMKKTDRLKYKEKTVSKINRNIEPSSPHKKIVTLEEPVTEVESSINLSSVLPDSCSGISQSLQNKFSNKSKLIAWLEASYKQYKRKAEVGNVNLCLGPPQPGKMALYPWDFILSRYQERKNYFLITKIKPYRLFMTVNENNQFFSSSTNINSIPWSDIDKYPITVRNLLTNATDTRDNFYILFGLTHSWELVGSVTKVSENVASADVNLSNQNNECYNEVLHVDNILESDKQLTNTKKYLTDSRQNKAEEKINECSSDSSKWFVMTIENDFSEIQFFNKGFFVKYESVMKAISVSRASKKTVRLSSQKCNSPQSDPQFGIYAIPNENDSCVFIGPYEKDEKLGIETINTTTDHKSRRTRGIWITTKKVDNLRVIDNPLSFMPTNSSKSHEIPLHSHFTTPIPHGHDNASFDEQNQQNNVVKTLKPIRIGKTNSFYHLTSDGTFHQISPEKSTIKKPSNACATSDNAKSDGINSSSENKTQSESIGIFNKKLLNKPIAEIAPQVKNKTSHIPAKRKLEGMFVLKPEEINQRSFERKIQTDAIDVNRNTNDSADDTDCFDDPNINNDIENFLASYAIKVAPKEEIYVISDDEEDDPVSPTCNWKYQYIICKNIKSLGWIHGRRDFKDRLSFEFPGFKETDFYPENEAFAKINQVFSRKVYVPKNITLEWCTVDDISQIGERQKLENDELNADYIMTKKGLCHKSDILRNIKVPQRCTESDDSAKPEFTQVNNSPLSEVDETSMGLEDTGNMLLTEILSKKESLMDSLGDLSDIARIHYSKKLQEMYTTSDDTNLSNT